MNITHEKQRDKLWRIHKLIRRLIITDRCEMYDCYLNSGRSHKRIYWVALSYGNCRIISSSPASLLHRKPHRTLLPFLAHYHCQFSTTAVQRRSSWNRYVEMYFFLLIIGLSNQVLKYRSNTHAYQRKLHAVVPDRWASEWTVSLTH